MKRKKASKSSGGGSSADPDIEQIEKLLKTMSEHNLEEFEYSRGELRIRLKKPSAGALVSEQRTTAMPEIIVAGSAIQDGKGGLPRSAAGTAPRPLDLAACVTGGQC